MASGTVDVVAVVVVVVGMMRTVRMIRMMRKRVSERGGGMSDRRWGRERKRERGEESNSGRATHHTTTRHFI